MSRLSHHFVRAVFFMFVTCAFVFAASSAAEASAASAVAVAEADAVSAHEAVVAAEQVGVDVSGLVVQLNDAVGNLAEAEVAYRLGEFDESVRLAGLCSGTSGNVRDEAEALWLQASGTKEFERQVRIVGSLVSMAVIGLGGFWSWRVFKRRYCQRVLAMKPEVVAGDA